MFSDKKKIDKKLRVVIIDRIGHPFLHGEDVEYSGVTGAIDDARGWFSKKR